MKFFERYNVIDKNSAVPVYYQIQNLINNLIEQGKLKKGDKLPTETELCKIFNTSRMTVRQALNNLVNSGKLLRQAGKGTFVASDKILFDISLLRSFSEDMKSRGYSVTNKLLEKKVIKADKNIAEILQIPVDSEIFFLKRLRLVNSLPAAIEATSIPLNYVPDIQNEDFINNSLFTIFEKKYNLKLDYSEQIIEPVLANNEEAKLLDIKPGSPLLKMTGKTFLKNGKIIEYVIGIYRGDRYKFRLYPKRL